MVIFTVLIDIRSVALEQTVLAVFIRSNKLYSEGFNSEYLTLNLTTLDMGI